MRAIDRLRAEIEAGELQLVRGTLYLVHGNPRATAIGERHTAGGVDLNRLFDYRFEVDLPTTSWAYEHYRAVELKPLLQSVDVLLDLHSTTAPSPPFGIVSPLPESRAFAAALDLPYVTEGWDGPGLLADQVVLAPMTLRGLPAMSVECGQHDEAAAVEVAYQCIRRALVYWGLIAREAPSMAMAMAMDEHPPATTWLRLRAAVKRPSAEFKFTRPLTSMQELAAGEVIGRDDDLVLTVNRPCYVIMPNDGVAVGDDMVYIAHRSGGEPETDDLSTDELQS